MLSLEGILLLQCYRVLIVPFAYEENRVLKETVTKKQWGGILLILVGIVLVTVG